MKYKHFLFIILLFPVLSQAQFNPYYQVNHRLDSLHSVFQQTDNDTLKMNICWELENYYKERDRDTTLYFSNIQLELAKKLKQPLWQIEALNMISYELMRKGNYPEALKAAMDALKLARDESSEKNPYRVDLLVMDRFVDVDSHKARISITAFTYQKLGQLHDNTGNSKKAVENYREAIRLSESVNDKIGLCLSYLNLAVAFLAGNQIDSAMKSAKKSLAYSTATGGGYYDGSNYLIIANTYLQKNNFDSARHHIQRALKVSRNRQNSFSEAYGNLALAQYFFDSNQPDSIIFYANHALELFKPLQDQQNISASYAALSTAYQYKNMIDSAFTYLQLAKNIGDSLARVGKEQTNKYLNLNFDEQLRLRELEEEKASFQTKIRTNTLLGSTFTLLIIAFFLYKNIRQKKKANATLKAQKEEIEATLEKLKSTQTQLIQSEKMASLGELTAGIAHEIQNPLNFVNNFAEVSGELIEELKEEREKDKGERDQELEEEILNDVTQNLEKINHHGQRASGIVKGMLEHSRTSTGKKELTDINKLADEYLRLAYHGLRAKDKSFNADFNMKFDETLPKINVVSQDIGRVLLNLINNAFYTVDKKAKLGIDGFKPEVKVTTEKVNDKVVIKVWDNGEGIPEQVRKKIFQPFFTTKPTGSGTGLGLSLAYDIITKGHGGHLEVETEEGMGTRFVVKLPISESQI